MKPQIIYANHNECIMMVYVDFKKIFLGAKNFEICGLKFNKNSL